MPSLPAGPSVSAEVASVAAGGAFAARLDARFAVLRAAGADAVAFLHGQLSSHVSGLAVPGASLGSYNTAKGRMLATMLVVRVAADELLLVLDASIAAAIEKRLRMFVLRAKVALATAADRIVVGLAGPACAASGVSLPARDYDAVATDAGVWVRLPGERLLGLVAPESAAAVESAAAAFAPARDPQAWGWLDIAAGIPWITTATQDQLVAQMANFELLGGVHFQKGCYPGQEIVARTQHIGRIKRRMYRGHVATEESPVPGDPVYGADVGDQASGLVVNAAPAPAGGFDVLAVMYSSTAAAGRAHLKRLDGPAIRIEALPYAIE